MPPLFTSTNINTLLRKVISTARQVHPKVVASGQARVGKLFRARQVVQQVLNDTFPSLQYHPRGPSLALQPAYIVPRFSHSANPRFASPLAQASQAFRSGRSYHRGPIPRGPGMITNVGLGSARTFATAPTAISSHIPLGFRAISLLLDEHDDLLPQPVRYKTYVSTWSRNKNKYRRHRQHRRRTHLSNSSLCGAWYAAVNTVDTYRHADLTQLDKYFPLPSSTQTDPTLPPRSDELITHGTLAILQIPLSPDFSPNLQALFTPTPDLTFDESMIGVTVLSKLTRGLMPIHEAFGLYQSHRVLPLLYKLDGLGLLDARDQIVNTELEAEHDLDGRLTCMRIVFHERSVSDIRRLLGETLKDEEEGQWWSLWQEKNLPSETLGGLGLSMPDGTSLEDWSSNSGSSFTSSESSNKHLGRPSVPPRMSSWTEDSTISLVIPTIDVSITSTESADLEDDQVQVELSLTPPEAYSWPSSADISPMASPPPQLTSLNISTLSEMSFGQSEGVASVWSVSPSEDDSDVESSVGEDVVAASEVWSLASGMQESVPPSPSDITRWNGSGEGFGFAQPW
ncbi:hypothetical protein BCR39DRAFT_542807 [Naematelia encephala]|uniref:Uncharacterized protein n=1 Tax=Naematelia encephala TaxID=71784 RepID=A0A1Y2AV54_9TREE|nr:hypothetical protein BCR39DRAFT_542807 [Naematelia encephala]